MTRIVNLRRRVRIVEGTEVFHRTGLCRQRDVRCHDAVAAVGIADRLQFPERS
jgi:hypothetical protein